MTPAPDPTFWDSGYPRVFGVPSGRYELRGAAGEVFLLPLFGVLDAYARESNDSVFQAPGSRGGLRTGLGTFKPLALEFGTGAASLDAWLSFATEADAVAWERAFLATLGWAVRLRDTATGEEFDGFISRARVPRPRYSNWRKLELTFSALDSHPWLSAMTTVQGNPAACPNGAAEPAYPYITLTAASSTVTVSDGTRTLTVYTTAGHTITVDSGRADGVVTDDGGLANYSGRFPRIDAGGSTLTTTGATGVQVRYRQPAFGKPVITQPTTGTATEQWTREEWNS